MGTVLGVGLVGKSKGVSCRRAGLASPTLLAEAWFQNGLIAGDTDTLFISVCPAHAWLLLSGQPELA